MSSPIGEEHDESVDNVVITTRKRTRKRRRVVVMIIIGRKELKCYNDTKITTINYVRR